MIRNSDNWVKSVIFQFCSLVIRGLFTLRTTNIRSLNLSANRNLKKGGISIMDKKRNDETAPNVSGSFQIVTEDQQRDLEKVKKEHDLDEKSLYYARDFMED